MRATEAELAKHGAGSTFAAVTGKQLKAHTVSIAPTLAEQHRIVDLLESHLSRLDAAGSLVVTSLGRLMSLRKSVLADLHDGDPAPLCELAVDSGYGTSEKCVPDGPGPAVVRIPNLVDGRIDLFDEKRIASASTDVERYRLTPGELLIVRTNGSVDLIGRSAVVQEGVDAAFASYLIRYQFRPDRVMPEWVRAMLSTPQVRARIEALAASSAGQHNLSLGKLNPLEIPVPSLDVQAAGLSRFTGLNDQIRRLRNELAAAQSRSGNLRRSGAGRRILRSPDRRCRSGPVGGRGDDRRVSGKQIKLFLVDGTPGGLTTAEITNWTGHVLSARRSDLADLLKREEAQRTGVYLLLGDDEAAIGDTRCYIGEADVVADRLRYHNRDVNKDFWDRVVLVTSKDTNLTKSHGRYLESRLISLATQAGRVSLENGTAPPVPALPEADASDMDYFLSQLQIVLPVLGVNAIRVRPTKPVAVPVTESTESPVFRLRQAKLGVDAQAQQIDGEFTMLAGSIVVASWHGVGKADSTVKAYASYRAKHEQLVSDGSIVVENGHGRLTRDIVFSSPSTAGAVALGRSCNGRREWIAGSETFGDWESRGVE